MAQVQVKKISVDDKNQQRADEENRPGALKEMQIMKIIPDWDFNSTLDHLLRHKV